MNNQPMREGDSPTERGFSNPRDQSAPARPAQHISSNPDSTPPAFFDPYTTIEQHRHTLPHWQQGEVFYFVTWRLADALPQEKLYAWRSERDAWLHMHPKPWNATTERECHGLFSRRIDTWLDAGSGSCLLRNPDVANIVARALRHFDSVRYTLATFVLMPNHVHALFRLIAPHRLEAVVKSWKGFTARAINQETGRSGPLWQEDYWDRLIRNEDHFGRCREYILGNPALAGLREGEFVMHDAAS